MKPVVLSQGAIALVDDHDFERVTALRWELKGKPGFLYAQRSRNGKAIAMHRFILGAAPGQIVDHINGDGLDNRRSNLRLCSALENTRNRTRYARKKRASGGYLGVTFHRQSGLWFAFIHAGERDERGEARRVSLKYHATAEAAARVYDSAATHYFGEFAALNFPEEKPAPFNFAELRGSSSKTAEHKAARSRENVAKARAARWAR